MNNKYYIIKKKSLAEAINFLTGQRYYRWNNYNRLYRYANRRKQTKNYRSSKRKDKRR